MSEPPNSDPFEAGDSAEVTRRRAACLLVWPNSGKRGLALALSTAGGTAGPVLENTP